LSGAKDTELWRCWSLCRRNRTRQEWSSVSDAG